MCDARNGIERLTSRLQAAAFSGTLELRFERDIVAAAEIRHYLANSEFQDNPLPSIESKETFTLTPSWDL